MMQDFELFKMLSGPIFVLLLIGAVCILCVKLKRKLRGFISGVFGTSDIGDAIRQIDLEALQTPKSLSGTESMAAPLILKDFPEMSLDELKSKNIDKIYGVFTAIEEENYGEFADNEAVKNQIASMISDIKSNGMRIDSLNIHKQVINRYIRNADNAVIRFQTAIEYRKKTPENSTGVKIQERVQTEWIYMLDRSNFKMGTTAAVNCPNCKAPITNYGEKFCQFCGTAVIVDYKRTWDFNSITFI